MLSNSCSQDLIVAGAFEIKLVERKVITFLITMKIIAFENGMV